MAVGSSFSLGQRTMVPEERRLLGEDWLSEATQEVAAEERFTGVCCSSIAWTPVLRCQSFFWVVEARVQPDRRLERHLATLRHSFPSTI